MKKEEKQELKSIILEDKEFLLALIDGNIEKEDHKKKQERIKEIISKIE